jgi:very-short-patch-repair endonuclease
MLTRNRREPVQRAEERLLALIRTAELPAPETNARVGPYEVDFLWRSKNLIVEVDGFAFHSSRSAFERDRAPHRPRSAGHPDHMASANRPT